MTVKVRARLRLLPTSESERTSPIFSGYRPNHNFDGPLNRETYIGQVDLVTVDRLQPGEDAEVSVAFFDAPGLIERLQVGVEWRVQEGVRLMGLATMLERLKS